MIGNISVKGLDKVNTTRSYGPLFDYLKGLEPFKELRDEVILNILSRLKKRRYSSNEFIFCQESPVDELFIVEMGRIEVFKQSSTGKKLTLWHLGPGDLFCLGNLFVESAFANAVSIGESLLYAIEKEDFLDILSREQGLVQRFIGCVSRRLSLYLNLVDDLTFKSVPERLASFLIRQANVDCKGDSMCRLTQSEVASLLGTKREVVSRALKRLSEQGIIELIPVGKARHIRILDEERLMGLATGDVEEGVF